MWYRISTNNFLKIKKSLGPLAASVCTNFSNILGCYIVGKKRTGTSDNNQGEVPGSSIYDNWECTPILG
jgi:hypothetical protein